MSTTATVFAGDVIATLQAHEAELRRAGIRHLSLFGSVARGDAGAMVSNEPAALSTSSTALISLPGQRNDHAACT